MLGVSPFRRKEHPHMPIFNRAVCSQTANTAMRICIASALLCVSSAHAEGAQSARERQSTYKSDRERCLSGQTGQNQASCLQEAGAVLQQRPSGQGGASPEQLKANALQRCDALTGDDRQSCLSRMQGQGSVQGSAASGGIIRELTEPAK
jgi:hypothetical protein